MSPILLAMLACGRETTPTAPAPAQSVTQPTPPVASLAQEEKRGDAIYQSKGRRDPFRPPQVRTMEQPPMVRLTLTGIVRETQSYVALVESDSSPGMGYIIRENDIVDSAKVVRITRDSVVFAVETRNAEGKSLIRYVEKHMPPIVSR